MSQEEQVVPGYDAAEEAGKLIMNLPALWAWATLSERRRLLIIHPDNSPLCICCETKLLNLSLLF